MAAAPTMQVCSPCADVRLIYGSSDGLVTVAMSGLASMKSGFKSLHHVFVWLHRREQFSFSLKAMNDEYGKKRFIGNIRQHFTFHLCVI